MKYKQILKSQEARNKILEGVNIVADTVKTTLGAKGRNVAIEKPFNMPHVTKDGVSVAKEIVLRDRFQNVGAQLIKGVAQKTNERAGDGTTTATVLAQAIANEGNKYVMSGFNPMDLKRGIDLAVKEVINELKLASKPIQNDTEITNVGTISANGDAEIGNCITSLINKVGSDGVMAVQEGKGLITEIEIIEGMEFNTGWLSPYFVTNAEKMICEYENPYYLLFSHKISHINWMIKIFEAVVNTGRPLVVISDDMENDVLSTLVANRIKQAIKVVAIKVPGHAHQKNEYLEDIAIQTGGTIITPDTGDVLEEATLDKLGQSQSVKITRESTIIFEGKGNKEKIAEKIVYLKELLKKEESDFEKERLVTRIGRLNNGIGIIKVGGATEVEVKEKKDRVEDALNATKAAIQEGIVAGGGVALYQASKQLSGLKGANHDQDLGIAIVKKAICAPLCHIASNSGMNDAEVMATIKLANRADYGLDVQTLTYGNMIEKGIIDPTKVVRSALEDAASIASLLITTEAVICIEDEDKKENPYPY